MFASLSNLRLRWKVLCAPGFLILVLIGFGGYALHTQQSNQATVNALMAGPVRQAELVADFGAAAWASEVRLYRLMATAANESDEKKVKDLSDRASASLSDVAAKFNNLASLDFEDAKTAENIGKLKTAVADYVKRARGVIDMADSDSGTALMLMQGAAQSFAGIEQLTADLNETSKNVRDHKLAADNAELEQQKMVLIGAMLGALIVSCLVSLLISRGISRPVVGIARAIRHMAEGNFDLALPGLGRKDEIGEIATAVEALKQKAIEKARSEADAVAARQAQEAESAAQQRRKAAELHAQAAEERAKVAEDQANVLRLLAAGLKSLSDGDLTIYLDEGFTGDHRQIRDDFNAAVVRLHETIRAISDLARDVSAATADISSSTTNLSERTEEQAAGLEETAASMEEIAATVKKNAVNARHADQSAGSTREVADRSGQIVAKAVEAMAKIEELVAKDFRHYRRDRRDRPADQPLGIERRGGIRPCRRSRSRLCRGRFRGSQPCPAVVAGRQGHQGSDHQQQHADQGRRRSRQPRWHGAWRNRRTQSKTSPGLFPTSPMPAPNRPAASSRSTKRSPAWTR